MHLPLPLTRDLVLLGGGHAHALVLRRWGMKPLPGVRLTLVSPEPTAPYTGMLPGQIAGHYARAALEIDLFRLARFAGARLILDRATGIDRAEGRVHLAGGRQLRYDRLSLDVGALARLPDLPGYEEHVTAARPLADIAEAWARFLDSPASQDARLVLIGAGVGGAELAMAMAHRLRAMGRPAAQITLIDRSTAMPGISAGTRSHLVSALYDHGIMLRTDTEITRIAAGEVHLADGTILPADLIVGTPGAAPQDWLQTTGLHLTEGFVTVDAQLRSTNDLAIYAAGDCAHLSHAPRPKAGVYAVRAAPTLFHNLRADLSGGRCREFRPQSDFLRLISLGERRAVAQRFGLSLSGGWVWRWKDRIDRRFMDSLGADLKPMAAPALPRRVAEGVRQLTSGPAMCAGCGAKIGGKALRASLAALPPPQREDVVSAPGDDAAELLFGAQRAVISTDHLRTVTQDAALMARIAAHHALGDVHAMGAAPQAALATLILPPMSESLQTDTVAEIMVAAAQVFRAVGADIAGGHTTTGSELTIGFTVTGLLSRPAIGLTGAREGDALVLTKPLGSGTLMAADMALAAQAADVATALRFMTQPLAAAAILLQEARAMTDVTGFGLAGHLAQICRASGTGARINLADIPLMPGAEALARTGVRSTLYDANRAAVPEYFGPDTARADLLFDPQTSGGLLAAVDPAQADSLLNDLKEAGYTAEIIGKITSDAGQLIVD